jgi:hypothetical protein
MSDEEPVRLVLTPEQREVVKRLSGQHVEMIELEAEKSAEESPAKQGGALKFRWRLSAATGIPRQAWVQEEASPPRDKNPTP